jgi:hypothetical protein
MGYIPQCENVPIFPFSNLSWKIEVGSTIISEGVNSYERVFFKAAQLRSPARYISRRSSPF